MNKVDVLVVGGGPAGLMAAARAAARGKTVTVLDKNSVLARKLRITGKGRCNLTNSCDIEEFIQNVNSNPTFLYSSFYSFTNLQLMELFDGLGVALKTERGGRVFPQSDSAKDVADALVRYAKSYGVKLLQATVRKIKNDGQCFTVQTDRGEFQSGSVVLATGGKSYPLTGSTGDGYRFAEAFGHHIVPPKPSLVPLTTKEEWVSQLMGLSLRNVAISIEKNQKNIYSDFGEMLFTHFGVSGPVILSASAHLSDLPGTEYKLSIDLKPALSKEQLDKRVQRDFEKYINKNLSNALDDLLPQRLIPIVIKESGILPETKVHSVTKQQRLALLDTLKGLCLTINGTAKIDEAIITRGGISVKEVNPSTLESKLIPGLFFAGEVLDVDAYTGGFNLQIAFSTGFLAGENV